MPDSMLTPRAYYQLSLLINSDSSGRADLLATDVHRRDHAVAASSHSGETWAEARPSLDQNPVGGARNHGRIPEGSFSGQGRHKDGASLGEFVGSVVELLVWCNVTGKRWLTH